MKKILLIIGIVICGAFIFYLQFNYEKKYQPETYYQVYLDEEMVGVIESKEDFDIYVSRQGGLVKEQVLEYQTDLDALEVVDEIIYTYVKSTTQKKEYLSYLDNYHSLSLLVETNGAYDSTNKEKVTELINSFPTEFTSMVVINDHSITNYSTFLTQLEIYLIQTKAEFITYINENVDDLSLSDSQQYYLDLYNTSDVKNISYIKQVYMQNYVEENKIYLHTDDIYTPLGVNVQKINTYSTDVDEVADVYSYIIKKKPCTIEGYQFRIKKTPEQTLSSYSAVGGVMLDDYEKLTDVSSEDVIVYVTDPEIFEEAVNQLQYVFVDSELLDAYKSGNQKEITTVGTQIIDVYVEEEITLKETNIPVNETIYTNADDLSSYLLYGEEKDVRTVKVSSSDTITSLTYEYGISFEEFFLSNPEFTSINNMFYDNQEVVIAKTDPKINIAVEQYIVEDMTVEYETVEKYDNTINQGMEVVKQKGQNGVERVGQNVRSINGTITYVQPVSNVTIKNPKDKIIAIGTKTIPKVGSLASWKWPTKNGYRISSYFGYRRSPITGRRELHTGIDISGTGKGSPVYASNNGVIEEMTRHYSYGNYILINHNNGYYSTYAHMNGFAKGLKVGSTVTRGQVIGYVGETGAATGPHLHFEIRTCAKYSCVTNPLPYLRK